MDGDPRVTQLARLLGCEREDVAGARGREHVRAGALRLAEGLFEEAAASDDVLSAESAKEYLELRLAYLGDLVPAEAAEAIRARFVELASQWS